MISSLRGKLVHKRNNEIVVDVNGVGYHAFITKRLKENLPDDNAEVALITYLDVKETSLTLYGFYDEKEKELYKLLTSVSGIGPKIAHNILVHGSFEEIIRLISGSVTGLKIPGLGSKKLELISMSLKDKIFKLSSESQTTDQATFTTFKEQSRLDALNALMNLGYARNEAEKIIREVLKANEGQELTTEEIIKKSLGVI